MLKHHESAEAFWDEYLTQAMMQRGLGADEYEHLMDISRRTPYWIARQLFCDAIFCNYLEVAKAAEKTVPTLMYIAEHWADVAEPFCREQFPEAPTYVMGGHLMTYEYPRSSTPASRSSSRARTSKQEGRGRSAFFRRWRRASRAELYCGGRWARGAAVEFGGCFLCAQRRGALCRLPTKARR